MGTTKTIERPFVLYSSTPAPSEVALWVRPGQVFVLFALRMLSNFLGDAI